MNSEYSGQIPDEGDQRTTIVGVYKDRLGLEIRTKNVLWTTIVNVISIRPGDPIRDPFRVITFIGRKRIIPCYNVIYITTYNYLFEIITVGSK